MNARLCADNKASIDLKALPDSGRAVRRFAQSFRSYPSSYPWEWAVKRDCHSREIVAERNVDNMSLTRFPFGWDVFDNIYSYCKRLQYPELAEGDKDDGISWAELYVDFVLKHFLASECFFVSWCWPLCVVSWF